MTVVPENTVATTTEMIDPRTLTVDTNVRKDANLTPEFLAAIKEHGVLVPVVGHRTEDGIVHVLMGQRRTLAAVEVELATIPVHVVATPDEADRLATQVVENDHRRALTDSDRADAYHQLSLLGVSPTKIARRMGAKKQLMETALRVKGNETAAAALAQGITLEQSAAIEEFSDDPEAAANIHELTTAEGTKLTDEDADAVYITTGYSGIFERMCVADWKARGLRKGGKAPAGGMTEEEKAVRRRTIENNKAADSAEVVRREFLTGLLSRKTASKDTAAFIAHTLTYSDYIVNKASNNAGLTAQLLGTSDGRAGVKKHLAKTTVKPEMVSLAIMITAYENSINRMSWRHEDADHSYYFNQLVVWGYSLSDVEQLMLNP